MSCQSYLIYFLILPSPTTTPTDNKRSLGNRKQSCHNPTFLFWLPKQLQYQVGKANGIILVTRDSWEHLNANPQVTSWCFTPISTSLHSPSNILCSSLTEQETSLGTCHESYLSTALLTHLPLYGMFLLHFLSSIE